MDSLYPHAQDSNPETTFIYALIDPESKRVRYVGKANDPQVRLYHHLRDKKHTHKTMWLKSLKKKNITPEILVLEEVSFDQWQEKERYWIALYRSLDAPLTNGTDGGDGVVGLVLSEESRKKLSESLKASPLAQEAHRKLKGRKHTDEARQKISRAGLGRKLSEEQRKKTSESHKISPLAQEARQTLHERKKGKPLSEETRKKISKTSRARTDLYKMHEANRGRVQSEEERKMRSEALKGRLKSSFSDEHRKNLSESHKGKPGHPNSEETRKKISETHKGVPLSDEHRRRLSESHREPRKPLSEATKQKISEANKRYAAQKKERESKNE